MFNKSEKNKYPFSKASKTSHLVNHSVRSMGS